MKKQLTLLVSMCAAAAVCAAPVDFDFKDPKGVNNIVFKTDAPLESINGTASGISGKVTFDPAEPGAIKGQIVLKTDSLHVGNPTMKQHLHGEMWMDVAKFPEITFEAISTKNVKTENDVSSADLVGKLTVKGVAKEMTVPVKITFLKDKLKARSGKDGDLLVLRSRFSISRKDFGINAAKFEDKVSDEIELTLSLAGAAPKP